MSHAEEILKLGASELATAIRRGEITSLEATTEAIDRIIDVDRAINAVVIRCFDEARTAARIADAEVARARSNKSLESLPPLLGVPATIKECFFLAGTASSIGLTHLAKQRATETGVLVRRLQHAGAILLGKTNVPQMMLWHECDNPVYGRTSNPWNTARTTGGSTGGEAAIIAARGSFLGLGNDLGGSIRVPSHFCGIMGFKPTSHLLPRSGARNTLRGFDSIVTQPGPMARRVDDLKLAMRVLRGEDACRRQVSSDIGELDTPLEARTIPLEVRLARTASHEKLRIGWFDDDGVFPASPAVRRAVAIAREILVSAGCEVIPVQPPRAQELVTLYYNLLGSDGGTDTRAITRGSELDWRVSRMLFLAGMPGLLRTLLSTGLRFAGQPTMAHLVASARATSATGFWRLTYAMQQYQHEVLEQLQRERLVALIGPPHALPAPQHRKPIDLLAAASYAYYANILGFPAGVMGITRVRDDEQASREKSSDIALKQAAAVDRESAGLPVGVQVIGRPWEDDLVLDLMAMLERGAESDPNYPCRGLGTPITPATTAEGLPSS